MAIKMSQGLKQQQGLAMTPQLQQAIKLLTLTHLEMTNVIAEELVENPMLEETDNEQDHNSDSEGDTPAELEAREATSEDFSENPLMREKDEFDWESYADSFNSNSSAPTPNMASNSDPDEMPTYENIISKGMTLAEHLEWQLKMEDISADDWKLAQMIIGNINDDGYLEINFDELIAESGFKRDAAYELLEVIQRLDPVGCGSSNLKECLLAQARIAEERSPLLEKIIRDHLEDLQSKSFEKISKALAVSIDQIKKTALLLQNFHPKPGRLVAPQETHYILPDIFVVKVNDEGVPHLRVSKLYQEMIKKGAGKKNDTASEFVKEKLRAAEWLIKSILNRQRTIEKVAKTIVAKQQEFFKKGPKYLRPMILKDVANDIGMHESTVSRVTTNKFMHTPIGTFELKYFFNSAIGGKDGGVDIASEVLKLKIKAMFAGENPNKPFSDQKVVELLAQEGLTVARRTVTKYREMLGIDSSSKRKEKA